MGLYLCVFDEDEELEGLEVGTYEYFGMFRDCINELVEKRNDWGSICPTLLLHYDCDGKWETEDCRSLINEIQIIERSFKNLSASSKMMDCKKDLFNLYGIYPTNLYDCFIDVDGENLIKRLNDLCKFAVSRNLAILFQ